MHAQHYLTWRRRHRGSTRKRKRRDSQHRHHHTATALVDEATTVESLGRSSVDAWLSCAMRCVYARVRTFLLWFRFESFLRANNRRWRAKEVITVIVFRLLGLRIPSRRRRRIVFFVFLTGRGSVFPFCYRQGAAYFVTGQRKPHSFNLACCIREEALSRVLVLCCML